MLIRAGDYIRLQQDQVFDLTLISTIERFIVPHIGSSDVPDETIDRFGRALLLGSTLYYRDEGGLGSFEGLDSSDSDSDGKVTQRGAWNKPDGLTAPINPTLRELSAYWVLDLLLLASSAKPAPGESQAMRERLGSRVLPLLLNRCKISLQTWVADARLRGASPFPRVRGEEVNYLLSRLLDLRTSPTAVDHFIPIKHLGANASSSERVHLLTLFSCFADLLGMPVGESTRVNKSSIGSSVVLAVPVELPEDFELGVIGKTRNVLGSTRLASEEPTTYDVLARECLSAIAGVLALP